MSCPRCGAEDRRDDATGYHGADVCPQCAEQGWTYDAHGELINEREPEPVSEYDQVRR